MLLNCLCFGGRRFGQVGRDAVLSSVFYLEFLYSAESPSSPLAHHTPPPCTNFTERIRSDEKVASLSQTGRLLSLINDESETVSCSLPPTTTASIPYKYCRIPSHENTGKAGTLGQCIQYLSRMQYWWSGKVNHHVHFNLRSNTGG